MSAESKERMIMASNWQTPIVIDLVIGSVVLVVGLALAIAWSPVSGGAIGAAGATYVALVIRRRRDWAARRAAAVEGEADDVNRPIDP